MDHPLHPPEGMGEGASCRADAGPTVVGGASAEAPDDEPDGCAICLVETRALASPLQLTRCGHTFCSDCLGRYVIGLAGRVAPCPICRRALDPAHLPTAVEITLLKPARSTRVGLVLYSMPSGETAIGSVRPGSLAERAGLRSAHLVASIDRVAVTSAAHAADLLQRAVGAVTISVPMVTIAPPSPTPSPLPLQAESSDVVLPMFAHDVRLANASCCCFCVVIGQLAQRVLCRRYRVCCVLVASLFWLLTLVCFLTELAQAVLTTSNAFGNSSALVWENWYRTALLDSERGELLNDVRQRPTFSHRPKKTWPHPTI